MIRIVPNKIELEQIAAGEGGQAVDSMIRRWKRQVQRDELLYECKRREYYMCTYEKRKEKSKHARIKEIKNK